MHLALMRALMLSDACMQRCFPKCMTARVAHNVLEKYGDAASIPGFADLSPEVR